MKTFRSSSPTRFLAWAMLVGLQPLACTTEDVDPVNTATAGGGGGGGAANAGSAGAGMGGTSVATNGGGGGSAGTTGTAGAGSIANNPLFGVASPCFPIVQPLITDFTYAGAALLSDAGASDAGLVVPLPDPTGVTFGDYTANLSGGVYRYPSGVGDPYAVASDVSTNEWHLSGSIGNYSGFALFFAAPAGCNQVNAAAYDGISFTIRGSVAMGNALTFSVNTSANEISHLWLNSQVPPPAMAANPNSGRCLPTANQYDGSCSPGTYQVPVTETETTVTILWADLVGGRPAAAVNPAEITDIRWVFPNPPNVGTPTVVPYAVDFYIDDLSFVGGP